MSDHDAQELATRPSTRSDRKTDRSAIKAYPVGGGIASLSVAAFLIRDGDVLGHDITTLEELDTLGGRSGRIWIGERGGHGCMPSRATSRLGKGTAPSRESIAVKKVLGACLLAFVSR